MLEVALILVVAVWPVVGLVLLAIIGSRSASGKAGVLAPAHDLAEVLVRMYLWPIVLWRIRIARVGRGPGKD
jgi:hypothetical protein